ncbi:hypothetical protein EWM64_g10468 [Hericium alpestre]|uniref:BTB domain-containing protein n=1 Tax=Hericium alpestre TaxID=135208 RepID=A0A4Y9ZFL1_9AGAM|nr:hypothetical protein EWM64_g10468 [Hericium alpestre]
MPDPAEDLQKLLEALYCKPPHTPSVARPVLALSTKYEITHLRQLIIERLEADWPQTLDKWDELEDAIASRREAYKWRPHTPCVDDLFPEPASAMRLACDFNIPQILPPIFYHLLRIPIANDWALFHKDDPRATAEALLGGERTANWDLLRKRELLLMLPSRQELLGTMVSPGTMDFARAAKRDDELYFENRNVVMAAPSADNASEDTVFRIHKSVMAR